MSVLKSLRNPRSSVATILAVAAAQKLRVGSDTFIDVQDASDLVASFEDIAGSVQRPHFS